MKASLCFLIPIYLNMLVSCQEKDPEPDVMTPPTGCDGDLTGTDCQLFFVPKQETLTFPTGTEIKASEGIEINGDIVIDPSAGGDFTITATSGDIVIAGRILVKDTGSGNPSGGRYKSGKSVSRLKNGKAADGFTLTLDARGPNGNIILKKGATLFSGRGQHALKEKLLTTTVSHEGAAGGNGGLIILNALNGKVQLPDLGNTATQDELFVLGNGGHGANVELDANLAIDDLEVVEVRGGLGGNAGQLIIDALQIEGIPSLEAMETHPDFIYGGEGGLGGYVSWENAGSDKKYALKEIILQGGDGGNGAKAGGYGGMAHFTPSENPFNEIGDPVTNVFCYGGGGGDVFASPLPLREVWGGDGGEYTAPGVTGWHGGEDKEGNLIRNGANGGNALGQGGNGGDILAGVNAYQAVGGSGGNSEQSYDRVLNLPPAFFGVVAGDGGNGYSDCEGCLGGDGGNAGKATALGGKGGDVLGRSAEAEAIQSFGGAGGDIWLILRGTPGNGGHGNPAGVAGSQPSGTFLTDIPGEGGQGSTPGLPGETLTFDEEADLSTARDGETCGEDLECEEEDPSEEESCLKNGDLSFTYNYTATSKAGARTIETVVSINGVYVEESSLCGYSCWECEQNYESTTTFDSGGEPVVETRKTRSPCNSNPYLRPFCTPDGDMFYLSGSSSVNYTDPYRGDVSESFSGCYFDDTTPAICCPRNDGYYFSGAETCPE